MEGRVVLHLLMEPWRSSGHSAYNSDGKTLHRNKFAWNHAANVLFVESPAGVGFSFSNISSYYNHRGDEATALDDYVFLLKWLDRFPEYKDKSILRDPYWKRGDQ